MAEKMAERDPVAAAAQKYRPIQSAVPGTTLGPIQIDAFLGGGVCVSVIELLYVKLPYEPMYVYVIQHIFCFVCLTSDSNIHEKRHSF